MFIFGLLNQVVHCFTEVKKITYIAILYHNAQITDMETYTEPIKGVLYRFITQ